ncbi:MAG: hypothetical protein K0R88_589 [Solirubrobacterales bacterium]|jgi:hypothetical protein|nr:hypothetical protein [Solirubrobacterales bacterium]MDF2758469.1 hypothetical protein [Thermomicrobiales bacterium]
MTPEEARTLIRAECAYQLRACRELESAASARMNPWSGRPVQVELPNLTSADELRGRYLRHRAFHLFVEPEDSPNLAPDATFFQERPPVPID